MSFKTYFIAAAVSTAFVPAAFAMPTIDLGGVVVPLGQTGAATGTAFVSYDNFNPLAPDVASLQLFGQVARIGFADSNDQITGPATFSIDNNPPVELTYELLITSVSPVLDMTDTPIPGQIQVNEASIRYYIDAGTAFDSSNAMTATDGSLFLTAELVAPEIFSLDALGRVTDDVDGLLFNVIDPELPGEGAFNANFDTNTQAGGADIFTFSVEINNINNVDVSLEGILNGTASGNTSTVFFAVSEPATLGLLGLGLVGLGMVSRRRKS